AEAVPDQLGEMSPFVILEVLMRQIVQVEDPLVQEMANNSVLPEPGVPVLVQIEGLILMGDLTLDLVPFRESGRKVRVVNAVVQLAVDVLDRPPESFDFGQGATLLVA